MTELERIGSERLRSLLVSELIAHISGVPVGTQFGVDSSSDLCGSLELFLPQLLADKFAEWRDESLDGFFVALASKTGMTGARLAGTCILTTDQTVTPFTLEIRLDSTMESLVHVGLRIGETGTGQLGISGRACNSRQAQLLLSGLAERLFEISWTYEVEAVASAHDGSMPTI